MMNNSELSYTTAPAFLNKLWSLVEDPNTDELICWDLKGLSFHVFDQARFAREILPLYFKHRNIASFIRQLNMYGFRKVVNVEVPNIKVESDDLEFAHQYFIRYQEHLLENIKRKISGGTRLIEDVPSLPSNNVVKIINEVKSLKVKQENMAKNFDNMKLENDVLWREVVNLRQQNIKQQEILNKLIQFLMSLVSKDRASIKRKIPLMITPPSALQTSSTCSAKNLDPPPAKIVRKATFVRPPIKIVLPQVIKKEKPLLEPLAVLELVDAPPSAQLTDCFDDAEIISLLQTVDQSGLNASQLDTPLLHPNLNNSLVSHYSPPPPPVKEVSNHSDVADDAVDVNSAAAAAINNQKNMSVVLKQDTFLPDKEDLVQKIDILQSGINNLRQLFSSGQYSFDANTLHELFGSEGPSVANSNLMLSLGEDSFSNQNDDLQNLSKINLAQTRGTHLMALSAPENWTDTSPTSNISSFMDLPNSGDYFLDGTLISSLDRIEDDKIAGAAPVEINVDDFLLEPTDIFDDFLDYDSII